MTATLPSNIPDGAERDPFFNPNGRRTKRAWHNPKFYILRRNMLKALGLPDKIPLGHIAAWTNVEVITGWWLEGHSTGTPTTVVLPFVQLVEQGVANRIQVACPECGRMMRFSGLQQHVGSPTCVKRKEKRNATRTGSPGR